MNEAAFKFKTFSATHPRKDEKTIWFLSALPMETDRDWSKTHLQIRGKRCCQGPHNSPSGRLSYMRMTWTVSRSSNDLALSLYVLLFVSSLNSSINFSVSGFPAPCDPENVVDPRTGSRSGVCPAVLMAVIAHEMDLKMGLFEISKLHDYWSLPGAYWLEMLFDLLWSP